MSHHEEHGVSRRQLGAVAGGAVVAALSASACSTMQAGQSGQASEDAFATLVEDHRRVDTMFERMLATTPAQGKERTALLMEVKRELTRHAVAEENVVYPAVVEQATLRGEVPELYQEHSEMKVFLYRLEQMPKDSPQWSEGVTTLRRLVREHAQEEETDVFPRMRTLLDVQQREALNRKIRRERGLVG
jgi:hemerythrin superfamily protein